MAKTTGSSSQQNAKKQPPKIEDVKKSFYVDSSYIVETVYPKNVPAYAIVNGSSKQAKIVTGLQITKDTRLIPYPDNKHNIDAGVILLPQKPEDYQSKLDLLNAIQEFIHAYADMPEFWEKIAAHYALMTWVFDLFSAVPYLRFLGDYECGKTRMQDATAFCSCRTVMFSGSATLSPMFRMIEKYKGTLSIDEADFGSSDLDSDVIKMLNVGYRRGGSVWRSDKDKDDYDPMAYNVFSPKILTTRRRFKDEATESRCLTYIVPKDKQIRPDIPIQLVPGANSFFERAQKIRNMCLQWRFDVYRSLIPDLNSPMGMPNRYREVAVPLLTIIEDAQFKSEFIDYLSGEGKTSKQESLMALLIQALQIATKNQISGKVRPGEVASAMIQMAKEDGEQLEITGKAVGDMMRQLRFEPAPRTGSGCHFYFSRTQIDNFVKQFHL